MDLSLGLVVVVLGIGVGLGAVVVWVLQRQSASTQDASTRQVVEDMRAELHEQRMALEARSDTVVRNAVDTVTSLAAERLATEHAKSQAMLDERDRTFGERAARMNEEFQRMRELVGELDRQRAQGMGDLQQRLVQAQQATSDLARTTGALKEALSSSRQRGQWGERMAEDVLRTAGFVKGINYEVQQTSEVGRPDFTFPLPAGRHLHMDVKFPLDNWLRHLEATSDEARATHLKAFVRDARNRVRELGRKGYADTSKGAVDQVLLFLPNEQLFSVLHDEAPDLVDEALQAKVVLCSPVTLFAVLAVIRQAVEDHMTQQRSDDILEALAGFATQWDKFVDHLEKVGTRITSAQRAFDDVNGVRRRQLERQLDRVGDLQRDEARAAVVALSAVGHDADGADDDESDVA